MIFSMESISCSSERFDGQLRAPVGDRARASAARWRWCAGRAGRSRSRRARGPAGRGPAGSRRTRRPSRRRRRSRTARNRVGIAALARTESTVISPRRESKRRNCPRAHLHGADLQHRALVARQGRQEPEVDPALEQVAQLGPGDLGEPVGVEGGQRQHPEVAQAQQVHADGVADRVERGARGVVAPEPVEQLHRPPRTAGAPAVPGEQGTDRAAGRAGERDRFDLGGAEQRLQHSGGERRLAAPALTGERDTDHDAMVPRPGPPQSSIRPRPVSGCCGIPLRQAV